MDNRLVQLSKTIAYVLRHHPGSIALEIDPAGWVEVDDLLTALRRTGHAINDQDITEIVAAADKTRYQLTDGRIRATHGHSIPVDLGLTPAPPPTQLFHGTIARFLPSITRDGLRPQQRHHVHLSTDVTTAAEVGSRRGAPTVLTIAARQMHHDGYLLYPTPGNVWLTATVPPAYITHALTR